MAQTLLLLPLLAYLLLAGYALVLACKNETGWRLLLVTIIIVLFVFVGPLSYILIKKKDTWL